MSGTPRGQRPIAIDPESVRSSGLLKDAITLYHGREPVVPIGLGIQTTSFSSSGQAW